jgi:uncharacterized membrane protein YeaQ/YmgE (transglycosylase-associated protein family)
MLLLTAWGHPDRGGVAAGSDPTSKRGMDMFGILGWNIFGVIVGAVLGGWMGRAMGLYGPEDPAGFLMSLVGAVVVLLIYRMAVGRRPVT